MKPASIAQYHAARSAEDRSICDTLREGIDSALPEAESKMWHAHPVWFLGGNPIVGYGKLKRCIRLMFWSGQSFETPGLTATGTFKAAERRYTDASQIDPTTLAAWLTNARTTQWDYKNIVKRKGRLERIS
ncbi:MULTISPECIES: DUF1801 domain-containing protein [unclassified Marinovum]